MRKRVLMIRTIVLMMSKWVITGKRVVKLSSQSRSMTCGRPAADSRLEASRLSDLDRHFPMHAAPGGARPNHRALRGVHFLTGA